MYDIIMVGFIMNKKRQKFNTNKKKSNNYDKQMDRFFIGVDKKSKKVELDRYGRVVDIW